jgi:hypothetical protein
MQFRKKVRELTLITTANTIGPRISAMFIAGTMAAMGHAKWTALVGDFGKGAGNNGEGEGERLGEGGPFVRGGRLICLDQPLGIYWPSLVRTMFITHITEVDPLMSMSQNTFPISEGGPERNPRVTLGQALSVAPDQVVGTVIEVDTFLFGNKHRSDIVGMAFWTRSCQILPLLRIYYSVYRDSGYRRKVVYNALDR